MRYIGLIAIIGLTLSGCAKPPVAYDHPTASLRQLHADRADCAIGGKSSFVAFRTCMTGKGYVSNPSSGRLVVPDHLKIPMR